MKKIPITNLIEIIGGGTPTTTVPEYWGGKIPWVSIKDFNNELRWISTTEKTITESGLKESNTTLLDCGDLIISARGTVGKLCQLKRPMAFNQSCYGIRGKKGVADTTFIYYALRHGVNDLKDASHGTIFDTITRNTFSQVAVTEFTVKEQTKIGEYLGAFDDLIEENQKINKDLEALAQALFKSWFVDFDPVHAKMRGENPTGMDVATAALFPDSFQESELGPIPKGWDLKTIKDAIKRIPTGKKYEKETALESGKIPILDQGRSGVIGYHNDEPGLKASIDNPLIVFANHTCYMRLITYPASTIQNVLPFIGINIDPFWTYQATIGKISFSEYKGHWPSFLLERIMIPSELLTKAFGLIAKKLATNIQSNIDQNQELTALRDTIAPYLLSGKKRL